MSAFRDTAARLRRSLGAGQPPQPTPPPRKQDKGGGLPHDYDEAAKERIRLVKKYTMTSSEKLFALINAVRYTVDAQIEGAIVECGVWRGGSMHAVARTLDERGVHDRELYLFDTFEGMTEPTDRDRKVTGDAAADLLAAKDKRQWVWAVASIEDVRAGLQTLPYPYERFHLVQGPVEETIPEHCPDKIALLRLDTDWYESTKHELEHMYDRLQPGGVLIIDDYGTWQGSKEATDEFLDETGEPLLMIRVARARFAVKPGLPAGG
jgi:O-methyltransferase